MKILEYGQKGDLLLDEMSIQQKIEVQKKEKGMELVGLVELGQESKDLSALRTGSQKRSLGTHVLQFVFQGLTGF